MSGKGGEEKKKGRRKASKAVPPRPAAVFLKSGDMMDFITGWVELAMDKLPWVKDKIAGPLAKKFMNWGMRWSLFPLHFGIMCCALEMGVASTPRFDTTRFGIIYRSSPRQCDVLIITGPVSHKLRPTILRLWEQMPEPKWVIAMGECAISGGPYYDSYSIIKGADQFLPVDIYIPGCPVRPEALIDGFLKLQDLIEERKGEVVWRWHPEERKKIDGERRARVEKKLAEKSERYRKMKEEKGKKEAEEEEKDKEEKEEKKDKA